MFPNLRAELARRDITTSALAVVLNTSPIIVERKLSGKKVLGVLEAKAIRDFIDPSYTLEYLFATKV